MQIIKDIGSYAGFAAVVGLAVLSALYFSQARDLKRLREWAGRAPDRDPVAAPAVPQRVVAQPVPRPGTPVARPGVTPAPRPGVPGARPVPRPPGAAPTPAAVPTPGTRPLPAQSAAAGAAPAVASGGPAVTEDSPAVPGVPETANGTQGHDQDEDTTAGAGVSEDTAIHPPPAPPGADDEPESEEFDAAEEGAEDGESGEFKPEDLWEGDQVLDEEGEPITGERPVPAPAPAPVAPAPRAVPARTSPPAIPRDVPRGDTGPQQIIPPYERSRPGGPSRTGPSFMDSPRKAVMVIGGTILGAVVIGFGIIQLTGGDDTKTPPSGGNPPADSAKKTPSSKDAGASPSGINPKDVTVAVLNGTTVPGLARDLGDKIAAQGFTLGNVTNSGDQQRAESVVLFAAGAEKEAAEVAKRMKIVQREPIDPESQALGADASVVVIAGQNLTGQ